MPNDHIDVVLQKRAADLHTESMRAGARVESAAQHVRLAFAAVLIEAFFAHATSAVAESWLHCGAAVVALFFGVWRGVNLHEHRVDRDRFADEAELAYAALAKSRKQRARAHGYVAAASVSDRRLS